MNIIVEDSIRERSMPLGILTVNYPDSSEWNTEAFYALADEEVKALQINEEDYDRKARFGENNYFRFFKKFKKTYPVVLQYESLAFKGRPFPKSNPVIELPYIVEVSTMILSGCHDIDRIQGDLVIYTPAEKEPFMGMRGEMTHTYPNDMAGRDDGGIILSMIAGADDRTAGKTDSRNVFYPIFGTPGQDPEELRAAADAMVKIVKVLAPNAVTEYKEFI